MHKQKIENIIQMPGEERYFYFIRKVTDFEEVWGLYANGWATTADGKDRKAIPFWPEKVFADLCANGTWEGYTSKPIELDLFISKWLPGMEKDNTLAAIFQTPENKGIISNPKDLLISLDEELEQY